MTMMLSERDRERMQGLHPDLIRLVEAAAAYGPVLFMVIEGVRTEAQQAAYVASGASTTMNSRHLTGHAVDLGVLDDTGKLTWEWPWYDRFAVHMKGGSQLTGIPVEWGGDWTSFKDGPHWQLPWEQYPVEDDLFDEPPPDEVIEA